MKRGADRQLTKDDDPDGDAQDGEPTQGFQRADQKVLAARQIKGLPRRAGTSTPAPSSFSATPAVSVTPEPAAPAAPPKFSGFAGFGAAGAGSTPFGFSATPSLSKPTVPPPASSSNPFQLGASTGFGMATTTSSAFLSSASTPSVSATASAATKTFASLITPAASVPATASADTKKQVQNGGSDDDHAKFKAETKYYTALRGLNVSFLGALKKAIAADPFADVSSVLERYKALRASVETEYEDAMKNARGASTASSSSATPTPVASATYSFGKPAAPASSHKPAPTMPVPPTSFAGFSNLAAASSSSPPESGSGGFFKFGGDAPSSSSTKASLSFGPGASSASDSASSVATAPVKSAFSFPSAPPPLAGSSSGSTGSPFGDATKSAGSKTASAVFGAGGAADAPSIFSSNLFGGGGESSDSKDKAKEKDKDREAKVKEEDKAPAASAFVFGSSSSTPPTGEPPSASSPFAFGATSTGKPSTNFFGTFGKPAPSGGSGSFGNPVGFQFGSPPRAGEEDKAGASALSAAAPTKSTFNGFTFGSTPPAGSANFTFGASSVKSTDASEGEASEAPSGAGTPASEDGATTPNLEGKDSVHDQDGEGEEDEETTHEIRSKVFKLVKNDDGVSAWKDLGVGLLKVKINGESGDRRLLMRNSSTGKVTINFNVYKGMDATVNKNTVSFIGHEEGLTVPYRLKVKTNDQADELKRAIDREIEFVKAKEASD